LRFLKERVCGTLKASIDAKALELLYKGMSDSLALNMNKWMLLRE